MASHGTVLSLVLIFGTISRLAIKLYFNLQQSGPVLDKIAEFTYFYVVEYLLFYIPHHLISLSFELSALSYKRQFDSGGETASTGTKKLELHTERPVSS